MPNEFGIPVKIIRLIKMCLNETYSKSGSRMRKQRKQRNRITGSSCGQHITCIQQLIQVIFPCYSQLFLIKAERSCCLSLWVS